MSANRVACCLLIVACATGAHAQTEWIVDPEGPVLEPAPPGSWDHGLRLIETVIEVDGVYHMFYRGQPEPDDTWMGTYSIGHANSTDGLSWTLDPANPVLSPGSKDEWDHGSIRGAAVLHDGSQFRIWYAAVTPSEDFFDDLWHGIGHATSTDGSTWSKSVENPIITPGADGTFAVPQTVIFDGEYYRMWYASSLIWNASSSPAWSDDGMNWGGFQFRQSDRIFTYGLSVVSDGTRYLMMKWGWGYYPWIWGAASASGSSWSTFVAYPLITFAASPAVLIDGDALVMWYSSFDWEDHGIYRATSTCCDTTYAWFLLAAASGSGSSGSFYRTEVEINNAGEEPAEYNFVWFPRDQDNSEWIRSQLFQIGPGMNVRYDDVLSEVFDLGPGSFGALAVEATSEDLLAVGRISTTDDQNSGAYGQSVPAVRVDEFYSGERLDKRILFGAETADERFNITCFNGQSWGSDRYIDLDLYDYHGTHIETRRLAMRPFGSHQVNRIFEGHRPIDGYVQVENGWGTYCFGSRIDNRTNDPTTILPR